MLYFESSDKGHEEMSYCESSEESLSCDKLSCYFLLLPGLRLSWINNLFPEKKNFKETFLGDW